MSGSAASPVRLSASRLEAVRACELLDAPSTAALDRMARLARRLCAAPISVLTLIDDDRQVMANVHGLLEPFAGLRDWPLSHSLCQYVVESDGPLIIEDTATDPALAGHGAVTDLGVRSYAGVPVRSPGGHVLGALAVMDTVPRRWTVEDTDALEDLVAGALTELELRAATVVARSEAEGAQRHLAALRVAEQRAAAVLETALDCIVTMDADGRIVGFNPAAERTLGHSRDEAVGRELADVLIPPELRDEHRRALAHHLDTGAARVIGRRMEVHAHCADGTDIPVELVITRSERDGRPLFIGFLRDLRALRAADAAREEAERRARTLIHQVVDAAPIAVLAFDANGTVTLAEGLAARWADDEDAVGRPASALAAQGPSLLADLARAQRGERFRSPLQMGERRLEVSWQPVYAAGGQLETVSAIAVDVTERARGEERIAHLAYHDELTGLPNRRKLEDHLALSLKRATRTGQAVSVLSVDIDGFKAVNDGLGHAAGDELLRELARRLGGLVRGTDLVARQAGDEFVLVLEHAVAGAQDAAETVARKVVDAIDAPFPLSGTAVHVGASVGVATATDDVRDGEDLLMRADTAMYDAKRAGGRGYAAWQPTGTDAHRRLTLPARILRGIRDAEFFLEYQPLWDLRSGRPVACEALLRWQDPADGLLMPGDFIDTAQAGGVIEELGAWVAEAVCTQIARWRTDGLMVPVSLNASPRELLRDRFATQLGQLLAAHDVPPQLVMVEVTEPATMRRPDRTDPVLAKLRELGVRLAIDDFGSEHASLDRLRRLPVDAVKIDRSFLRGVPEDERAAAIMRGIIGLAEALGLRVVAEGIETEAQRRFLLDCGCEFGQGFHLGRPMAADALAALMRAH